MTTRARILAIAAVAVAFALIVAGAAYRRTLSEVETAADTLAPSSVTTSTAPTPTTFDPRLSATTETTGLDDTAGSNTPTSVPSTTSAVAGANTARPPGPPPVAPVRTAPPPMPAPPPPRGINPFRGLGAWMDVLDWSPTFTDGRSRVRLADIDRLAYVGVQTLYIQTSRFNRPEDVLDPGLLDDLIARAHLRGLNVVGWYLPTHEDPDTDLRRLLAAANLAVDGVGVDIESQAQTDIDLRNQRLVQLSRELRGSTGKPMAAIVVPPVVTVIINPNFWPGFPWRTLTADYDVWMPMGYWTNRTPESGWRDGYRYTAENIDQIRRLTGNPYIPVHPIGGIADGIGPGDVAAMASAGAQRGAIGGSLYDYLTTDASLWPSLQAFRSG